MLPYILHERPPEASKSAQNAFYYFYRPDVNNLLCTQKIKMEFERSIKP